MSDPIKIRLKPDIYPTNFLFWFSDDFPSEYEKAFKWAERCGIVGSNDFKTPQIPKHFIAFCDRFTYGSLVMGRPPKTAIDFAVLNHELLHAIFNAGEILGFAVSRDSEEFHCYMMQWLSHQLYKKLWK